MRTLIFIIFILLLTSCTGPLEYDNIQMITQDFPGEYSNIPNKYKNNVCSNVEKYIKTRDFGKYVAMINETSYIMKYHNIPTVYRTSITDMIISIDCDSERLRVNFHSIKCGYWYDDSYYDSTDKLNKIQLCKDLSLTVMNDMKKSLGEFIKNYSFDK